MPYLDIERLRYADYFDWYEGRLDSLYTELQPNNINGMEIVSRDKLSTQFNYFNAVSRFYTDAMLGDIPDIPPPAYNLLESATQHWAVCGESCFVESGGVIRAVRPDYVFPQFDAYDKDTITGYLFVFPLRAIEGQQQFHNANSYAQTARVIEYDAVTGNAYLGNRDYRYGYVADTPKGENIAINNIIWINAGESVYTHIRGIVREITIRLNILQQFLNSVSQSILQIDKDAIADGVLMRGFNQQRLNEIVASGLGLTVTPPFIGEEGARYIERTGQGLDESLNYLRLLLGQLGVMSGVPDYVFGVQLGRPADETERVFFTAESRINRYRRDIERAMEMLGQSITFTGEPFVTRSQRIAHIIELYETGIATLNETRNALGMPATNEGGGFIQRMIRGGNGA